MANTMFEGVKSATSDRWLRKLKDRGTDAAHPDDALAEARDYPTVDVQSLDVIADSGKRH